MRLRTLHKRRKRKLQRIIWAGYLGCSFRLYDGQNNLIAEGVLDDSSPVTTISFPPMTTKRVRFLVSPPLSDEAMKTIIG